MSDDGLFEIEPEQAEPPKIEEQALVQYDRALSGFKRRTETQFRNTIEAAKSKQNSLVILDQDTLKEASEFVNQIKKALKEIDKVRVREVEDPREYVSGVNKFCKSFSDPLEMIRKSITAKIKQYEVKKEQDHQKELKKAREERERLQAKLDEEAKKEGVESAIVPDIPIEKETQVRTASGTTYKVKKWVWEKVDETKIPRKYFVLDEKMVNKEVKEGARDIPGLRIYEDFDIRSRT